MPKTTLPASTKTTCKPQITTTCIPTGAVPGGMPLNKRPMKAKKAIYLAGAVICATLTIIFRTVGLPVALVFDAICAMAQTTNEATVELLRGVSDEE